MEDKDTIELNGKSYKLKPFNRKMQSEVVEWCETNAITRLMKNAKASDMPKDLINTQLTVLQINRNIITNNDPLATPYLLWLRTKDNGITLDECMEIPDSEFTEEIENIIFANGLNEKEDGEKKSE